jgi:hypothetical protein
MLSTLSRRAPTARAARALAVLAVLALAGACDDDELDGDDEPEIEAVRLTVTPPGGTPAVYTITPNGSTPSPVQLRVGTSTVTAQALDDRSQPIALGSDFELRIVSSVTGSGANQQTALSGPVTFTANGTLSSAIVATVAPTANIPAVVRLVHRVEQHSDFDGAVQLRISP